jgi:hypothetical protein
MSFFVKKKIRCLSRDKKLQIGFFEGFIKVKIFLKIDKKGSVFRVLLNRHQIPHHQPFLFFLFFNKGSFKLGVKYFVFYRER